MRTQSNKINYLTKEKIKYLATEYIFPNPEPQHHRLVPPRGPVRHLHRADQAVPGEVPALRRHSSLVDAGEDLWRDHFIEMRMKGRPIFVKTRTIKSNRIIRFFVSRAS